MQNFINDQILRRFESKFRNKIKNSYRKIKNIIENFNRIYDDLNCRFIVVNVFRDFRMKKNNFKEF